MALAHSSLYLFGKTGTGKSSTGNTILGRRAFKASASSTVSTTEIQTERVILKNSFTVDVVDGPGLVGLDSGFSKNALRGFRRVIDSIPGRGHVFLIVCRYGERFTSEDSGMVKVLEEEFGSDVFTHHGVVVVTCGNNFVSDYEGEGVTFESWCKNQGGDFGKLVASCRGRVVLVDNSPGGNMGDGLVEKLLKFMPDMEYGRKPFAAATEGHGKPSDALIAIINLVKRHSIRILIIGCILFAFFVLFPNVYPWGDKQVGFNTTKSPNIRDIAQSVVNATVNATVNGATSTTKTPDL